MKWLLATLIFIQAYFVHADDYSGVWQDQFGILYSIHHHQDIVVMAELSQQSVELVPYQRGNYIFSGNVLDFAIQGRGYFVLKEQDGSVKYTRDGRFYINRDNYMVDDQGHSLVTKNGFAIPATTNGLQVYIDYKGETPQCEESFGCQPEDRYRIIVDQDGVIIKYLAADAYYSKIKFIHPVTSTAIHLVGKLRVDANLQWLYEGEYSGKGRPKKFDGKIDFEADLHCFDQAGMLDDKVEVYTKIVYSNNFQKTIRVVMLRWQKEGKVGRALLYSTDKVLDALKLIDYYKARFQIEFLFRDAKQYTGLNHCQSPQKEAIHMQVNASLTALNLLKMEDRQEKQTDEATVISIASWKRRKFNRHFMNKLFGELGLDVTSEKVAMIYEQYSHYGAIAS